jgi:ribosome recycling factor
LNWAPTHQPTLKMYKEIIDKIRPELDKVINFLERELAKIRTGKATPSLVEDIEVECFGQKLLLKQLAAISAPESRQILIQPWDKSYLEPIQKALSQSTIGISPIVDKDLIRLSSPPLSEEYRKNLLKILSEKIEETRKTIRHWREEAWDEIQEKTKTGEIREDDKFRAKDELQDLIDRYNQKIEEIGERKKKEISS